MRMELGPELSLGLSDMRLLYTNDNVTRLAGWKWMVLAFGREKSPEPLGLCTTGSFLHTETGPETQDTLTFLTILDD